MWPFQKNIDPVTMANNAEWEAVNNELKEMREALLANGTTDSLRGRIASALSGRYDGADTLHNVYRDYGYPSSLTFSNYWNMYRRFGIAKNVVELPVDTGWSSHPEVEGSAQFNAELEKISAKIPMWVRMKGLDNRQRVGRYAGMFMRVKDGLTPDKEIEGTLAGAASLFEMTPLYESQLEVIESDENPASETYGDPIMYQYSGGAVGDRSEETQNTIEIHASRVVTASEGADDGTIYGIPALEATYNSLMDLRKIIGAGGEGFYKNAAQSIVFDLKDGASAKQNAALLDKFNENYDEFAQNRSRRAMWTPGMEAKTLESSLANPKEFFTSALNDVAAGSQIPATILIGQQTGRLASGEDSRHFLASVNSRRENYMTDLTASVIDWMIKYGILPSSEYEIAWDDLLARSDEEKLDNADKMAAINERQFKSGGGIPFDSDEVREAAGFDKELEPEEGEVSEELPEDSDEGDDAG